MLKLDIKKHIIAPHNMSQIEKKNKEVLIISPFFSPNIGGVETHLDDLTRYLTDKKKYKVYVLTYSPLTTEVKSKFFEKKGDSLTIIRIPWIGKNLFHKFESHPALQFLYLTPVLGLTTFSFMLVKSKDIKAIHAHGFTAALITNIISRIFKGKALVVSMHAIYRFPERTILAAICRQILMPFNKIFCLAQRSIDDLASTGMDRRRLSTYTQWVNQSLFKPRDKKDCRRNIGIKNTFTVLYPPSRLIEKKGAGVLLDAAKKCSLDIQFVFVGSGPMEEKILNEAVKNKNIIFAGRKNQEEAACYYGAADVVVVPSQYDEGFARVVLETLSSGRPIISSNLGCLPEMISDKVGFLVEPTVKNLAEKINYLYKNKLVLEKLTKNCRPYALRHFSENNAEEIEESYHENK